LTGKFLLDNHVQASAIIDTYDKSVKVMLADLNITEDDVAKWPVEEAAFLRSLRAGDSPTRTLKAEYVESLEELAAAK
jgi:hypothetical protein